MKEVTFLLDSIKKLSKTYDIFVSENDCEDGNYKRVRLYSSEYYLYYQKDYNYDVVYHIKQIFEVFFKEHLKRTENEDHIAHFAVLFKELLDTSNASFNNKFLSIEGFDFLDEHIDYAIVKNDTVIYNKNIDKFTINTSLLKLRTKQEFSMLVRNGEVFAVRTGYYKAILVSGSLIENMFKIALKVKLAFLSKFYENELYLIELRSMNSQLEETVRCRTEEIENKNRLLTEEKRKLYDVNLKLLELNKYLDSLSRVDPLTKLSNRRDLQEKFEYEVRKSKRKKTSLSLLIGDVDYFKSINDTYGHECGDQVLVRLARIFCDNLREEDVISRYGGEEFVILLTGVNFSYSATIAEKLRRLVESETFYYNKDAFKITISFGLYYFNGEGSFADSIGQADEALYKAKTQGRNKVVSILKYP